jgi:hypothetical protein
LLLISKGILWPALIVGALILAGALFALARPARGIPDLVAGTHLVVGKRSLPWDRWFTEYVLGTNRRN